MNRWHAVVVLGVLVLPAPARAADDPNVPETEVGFLPFVGGDSDLGLGFGQISAITRYEEAYSPYRWRLESSGLITFKPPLEGSGKIQVPYQDYFVILALPDLIQHRLRVDLRGSFTRETTQSYSGLGNASPPPDPNDPRAFQYGRIHPTIAASARLALGSDLYLRTGISYTHSWLDVPQAGRLREDMLHGSGEVRALLGSERPHGVALFQYAILYDTRDRETSTKQGVYSQLELRLSPGGTSAFPYRYGQTNLTARFYTSPGDQKLTLAARFVADLQFGDPPFYELARYAETSAIGGINGVRGVPAQRYYGKAKLIWNFEARYELVSFRALQSSFVFGPVLFFDAGRVWADYLSQPELDGTGIGLKYGIGTGVRLQQGKSFVVRGDVAWSPDARPIGAYFAAGQMF